MARRASLLAAVGVVMALAALGAAATPAGAPRSATRADSTPAAQALADGVVALRGDDFAQATSDGSPSSPVLTGNGQAVDAPTSTVRVRARVHQMSMDAKIQGGLTAHQEQALSTRLIGTHQNPTSAPQSAYWTPAMGSTAVARAESWLGMPYSWAGGSASGPTLGRCDLGNGGDLDCHVVGFDCSGLAMYAWGAYESLPHLAQAQLGAGDFHPTLKQLLPGDLVFFSAYLPGGTGHVAVYAGHGMVIEAPQSGEVIHKVPLAELMADDGAYRGAVRPMTGPTPALTASTAAVSTAGGLVTLHGTNLTSVDAVTVGGAVVRQFKQHSDSAIVFRAPAHQHGAVAVTVSTSWQASSGAVALSYVQPGRPTPVATRTTPVSPTAPSSTTTPTSPPSPTPPKSTPPPSSTPPSSTPPPSTAPPSSTPPKSSTPPPTPAPSTSSSTTAPAAPAVAGSSPPA